MRTCSVDGCHRPGMTRGWCRMHYMRWYRHANPRMVLDGGMAAINRAKTHCPSGHPYEGTNLRRFIDGNGYEHRFCVICRRKFVRASTLKAKAVAS